MKCWLVTAFGPFAGAQSNSSQIALEALRRKEWKGRVEFHGPVPVSFSGAWPDVLCALEQKPHVEGLLALGQAEGRERISLERVALNWKDARIADNAGAIPPQEPVEPGEADVRWSSVPWERLEPSPYWTRSYSAGTFVCNTLMYQSLGWARAHGTRMAGFVHIPVLTSQNEAQFERTPRMSDDVAVAATAQLIEFVLEL
ncbi:MAG: pyroglutamyl-peptidase I [Bdellovibrionales bacterium]